MLWHGQQRAPHTVHDKRGHHIARRFVLTQHDSTSTSIPLRFHMNDLIKFTVGAANHRTATATMMASVTEAHSH